jgi:TPR repeat protein
MTEGVCCPVCPVVCTGRGVPRDAQAALSYYGMAFDMGHWKAAYALGQLYAGNQRKQLVTITPATSSRC